MLCLHRFKILCCNWLGIKHSLIINRDTLISPLAIPITLQGDIFEYHPLIELLFPSLSESPWPVDQEILSLGERFPNTLPQED